MRRKDIQGINSGGSSNYPIASDFSTPQSHAINDESSVISNSVIDGVVLYTTPKSNLLSSAVQR